MRFAICFVWALTYIYLAELFPTVVRSLAMGLISAGGTVGSIICPFLVTFSKNVLMINPLITFGAVGLFGAISILPLRETLNTRLQDEIAEDLLQMVLKLC